MQIFVALWLIGASVIGFDVFAKPQDYYVDREALKNVLVIALDDLVLPVEKRDRAIVDRHRDAYKALIEPILRSTYFGWKMDEPMLVDISMLVHVDGDIVYSGYALATHLKKTEKFFIRLRYENGVAKNPQVVTGEPVLELRKTFGEKFFVMDCSTFLSSTELGRKGNHREDLFYRRGLQAE